MNGSSISKKSNESLCADRGKSLRDFKQPIKYEGRENMVERLNRNVLVEPSLSGLPSFKATDWFFVETENQYPLTMEIFSRYMVFVALGNMYVCILYIHCDKMYFLKEWSRDGKSEVTVHVIIFSCFHVYHDFVVGVTHGMNVRLKSASVVAYPL